MEETDDTCQRVCILNAKRRIRHPSVGLGLQPDAIKEGAARCWRVHDFAHGLRRGFITVYRLWKDNVAWN